MSGTEATWHEAAAWFIKAEQDLRAARLCIAGAPDLAGIAAYHCQQAAEKLLKGLLVAADVPFRKTHELDELADLAGPCFPGLQSGLDFCRPLSSWCTAYRYPSLDPLSQQPPSEDDIIDVVSELETLHKAILTVSAP